MVTITEGFDGSPGCTCCEFDDLRIPPMSPLGSDNSYRYIISTFHIYVYVCVLLLLLKVGIDRNNRNKAL